MNDLTFDYVFHLAGEQILPNYMAVKLCESPNHFLLVSDKTKDQIPRLQAEFPAFKIVSGRIDPYSYRETFNALRDLAPRLVDHRVGFNVTGGTKLMFAAALDFCRETGAIPFYLDTTMRKIRLFEPNDRQFDMPSVFDDVGAFVRLAGYLVLDPGKKMDSPEIARRVELTRLWWTGRKGLSRHLTDFGYFNDKKFSSQKTPPVEYVELVAEMLSNVSPAFRAEWSKAFPSGHDWRKSCAYAAGEWFEEHCLATVSRIPSFRDVRCNMFPGWPNQPRGSSHMDAAQEFDVVCTDGFTLYIVECKAGRLKQEYFQKLENHVTTFGGPFGRGCLASLNAPPPYLRKRVEMSRTISMTVGGVNGDLGGRLAKLHPAEIAMP